VDGENVFPFWENMEALEAHANWGHRHGAPVALDETNTSDWIPYLGANQRGWDDDLFPAAAPRCYPRAVGDAARRLLEALAAQSETRVGKSQDVREAEALLREALGA
jgi:hypothetical protein